MGNHNQPTILDVLRAAIALLGVGGLFFSIFGLKLQLTTLNIIGFIVIVIAAFLTIMYLAWDSFRGRINVLVRERWFWEGLGVMGLLVGVWFLLSFINSIQNELQITKGKLQSASETVIAFETTPHVTEISVVDWHQIATLESRISTLEAKILDAQGTVTAQETQIATLSPSDTGIKEELMFEEEFSAEVLDRNKWTYSCKGSEYYLLDGKLHLQIQGEDASESCIFKPSIDDSINISRIEFELTIGDDTSGLAWIGLFSSCEQRYFNVVGSADSIGLSTLYSDFTTIEKINSLPISKDITLRIADGNVEIISSEGPDSTEYSTNVFCYSNLGEVRFGTDRDTRMSSKVFGSFDNVRIWSTTSDE